MKSRERVLSTLDRKGYDRIPVKHEGTPEINQMLMTHFNISNMEQLIGLWAMISDTLSPFILVLN